MSETSKEQWKHGGNCAECRRKSYCSKPCSIKARKDKRELANLVMRPVARAFRDMGIDAYL